MSEWSEFTRLNKTPPALVSAKLEANEYMPQETVERGYNWLKKPDKSLVLWGGMGRGKTYFMFGLLRELINSRGIASARYFRSKNIDDRIMDDLKVYGTASYFMEQVKEIPYLFIDDFGVERGTERSERDYFEIIDERVAWERPTIITTNLTNKEILNNFGARIHSRLKRSIGIEFNGPDLREVI